MFSLNLQKDKWEINNGQTPCAAICLFEGLCFHLISKKDKQEIHSIKQMPFMFSLNLQKVKWEVNNKQTPRFQLISKKDKQEINSTKQTACGTICLFVFTQSPERYKTNACKGRFETIQGHLFLHLFISKWDVMEGSSGWVKYTAPYLGSNKR